MQRSRLVQCAERRYSPLKLLFAFPASLRLERSPLERYFSRDGLVVLISMHILLLLAVISLVLYGVPVVITVLNRTENQILWRSILPGWAAEGVD